MKDTAPSGADASRVDIRAFAAVADTSPAVLWLCDERGVVTYLSRAWYEFTGQARHQTTADWPRMLHEEDVERICAEYAAAIDERRPFNYDYRLRVASGGWHWVNDSGRPRFGSDGAYLGHIGTIVDVDDRVLQTQELRERERHLGRMTEFRRSVLELVEEGLATRDPDAFYQRMLERAVAVIDRVEAGSWLARGDDGHFGFAAVVGYDLEALRHVRFTRHEVAFGRLATDARPTVVCGPLPAPQALSAEQHQLLSRAGRTREIRAVLVIPVVVDGLLTAVLTLDSFTSDDAFGAEATEMARVFGAHAATLVRRFSLEAELHELAYRDALTGLANRARFVEALDEALEESSSALAVLFVDLDDLKPINDSLGHLAGDDVLREAARRLQACAGGEATIARLGGDEFTVMVNGRDALGRARALGTRILAAFDRPVSAGGHDLPVGASIGISAAPADGTRAEELLRRADVAMYDVKKRGKDDMVAFAPHMENDVRERLVLTESLRRGLERQELVLYYQPRVALATGRIVALEALLRWRHPQHGVLPAAAFIGTIESTSVMHALTQRVLALALCDARAWRADRPDVRVTVNVSAKQLSRPTFAGEVRRALEAAALPAAMLELEMLEGGWDRDPAVLAERIAELDQLGVAISLGGFGAGNAPVARLRSLPIGTVKIDRALVQAFEREPTGRERAIILAVADLGHALGARVAADAVERDDTWEVMTALGVDEVQGYLLSPAVPAGELTALLRSEPIGPLPRSS